MSKESLIDLFPKTIIVFQKRKLFVMQVKLSLVNQAAEGGIKNKLMVDKGIETPTHFI
jgi:hypothetical protein